MHIWSTIRYLPFHMLPHIYMYCEKVSNLISLPTNLNNHFMNDLS